MIKNHETTDGVEDQPHSPKKPAKRLTFIKVLVWMSILALVIGILLPSLTRLDPRRNALSVRDMSNLREVGNAMQGYAADNDGQIPPHPRYLAAFFYESVSQRDLFISPYQDEDAVLDRGEPSGAGFRYGGYVFLGLGTSLEDIDIPSKQILVYTARVSPEQTTRGVLFADGHTERWEEEQFRAALPDDVDVDALDGP